MTVNVYSSVHENALRNVNEDKHIMRIYLDLLKAFDYANHKYLLN